MNNKMPNLMMHYIDYFLHGDLSISNIIENYQEIKEFNEYEVYYSETNNTAFFTNSQGVMLTWDNGEFNGGYIFLTNPFTFDDVTYPFRCDVDLLMQDNESKEKCKVKDLTENCVITSVINAFYAGVCGNDGKLHVSHVVHNVWAYQIISLLVFDIRVMRVFLNSDGVVYLSNGREYLDLNRINDAGFRFSQAHKHFVKGIDSDAKELFTYQNELLKDKIGE